MREEDKLMTEQGQVLEKKPYNLRERKIKDAPYRNMIRAELADELPGKRVPNQGRFAYVDRQALCGKECRRNQYNGRFCQPSVVLCGFL